MMDWSAKLKLPYMAAAQAQKHVTHNEALALLDAIVQLGVEGFDADTPPAVIEDGAVYALGAVPTGAWVGQGGKLALATNGGWLFVAPQSGWRAALGLETRVWDGADWVAPPLPELQNVPGIGVGTSFSAGNPLAVAGEATLLTHAGAGHQLKVNKATAGDTASLLFQTGWSGRAEMGTAGTDDFAIKVSPDGSQWFTALTALGASGGTRFGGVIAAQTGTATAPGYSFDGDSGSGLFQSGVNSLGLTTGGSQRALVHNGGLDVTGLVGGTAVTQSQTDETVGRLTRVGDFGLGGTCAAIADLDALLPTGFYKTVGTTINIPAAFPTPFGTLTVHKHTSNAYRQVWYANFPYENLAIHVRSYGGGVWGPWIRMITSANLLGTATQSAGLPTGAILERGSNANGDYTRHADGTQICFHALVASTTAATAWTFPAVFSDIPKVIGTATATVLAAVCQDAAPTATTASFSIRSKTDARRADTARLLAIGRWF